MISRRAFLTGLGAVPLCSGIARSGDESFVSIIDSPSDTRSWIEQIAKSNVEIVGRYYSREFQSILPHKRMSENGDETEQLLQHGLAVLSEYQYESSDPTKFLFGVGKATGERGMDHVEVARSEAKLDADAAHDQAGRVGQPDKTAIYFGLDFDLHRNDNAVVTHEIKVPGEKEKKEVPVVYTDGSHVKNSDLKAACVTYFSEINRLLSGKYLIGLYGNGYASRLLREQRPRSLITYTWLSGSLSYEETTDVLKNTNDWHLFQNQLDRTWYGACGKAMDIATNIQNPHHLDIGAWKRGGPFQSSADRLNAIVDGRRVAKADITVFESMSSQSPPSPEMVCFDKELSHANPIRKSKTVRVIADHGDWLQVDVDDDGHPDGFVRKKALGALYSDLP